MSGCLHLGQRMRISRCAITAWMELATRNGLTPMSIRRRDGAGGIVGVQRAEDQVAGEGGLDGHLGHFHIADFADEDDVGRLTQHRPQDLGERQPDVVLAPGTG